MHEGVVDHINGYKKMPGMARSVFDIVHDKHLAAMGTEMRKDYTRDQIDRVIANHTETCIEVYYKNGEMFKYYPNYTWG